MTESMFDDLAEEDLLEVSGGCWKGCGPGGCGGRRSTTIITTQAPPGYTLSTIPGAPGYCGGQVQPGGFAGGPTSVKVVTKYGAHRFR